MKTIKIIFLLTTLLAFSTVANAKQTSTTQLQKLTEQLKKNTFDEVLREKIVLLGKKTKPKLPDAAIAFEGRAQFAFKNAKTEEDYLAAAEEYENALALAPWVPGYYSDLCTIYEKAGKLELAKYNCRHFKYGLANSEQLTELKKRIAGLDFGLEKLQAESAKLAWILGNWTMKNPAFNGPASSLPVKFVMKEGYIVDANNNLYNNLRGKVRTSENTIEWDYISQHPVCGLSGKRLPIEITFSGDRRVGTIKWQVAKLDCSLQNIPEMNSTIIRE